MVADSAKDLCGLGRCYGEQISPPALKGDRQKNFAEFEVRDLKTEFSSTATVTRRIG